MLAHQLSWTTFDKFHFHLLQMIKDIHDDALLCIPTYENVIALKRCMKNIKEQLTKVFTDGICYKVTLFI